MDPQKFGDNWCALTRIANSHFKVHLFQTYIKKKWRYLEQNKYQLEKKVQEHNKGGAFYAVQSSEVPNTAFKVERYL